MSKCIRKSVSHDGCLKVGGPVPSWTLSDTDSQKTYGASQNPPWIAQNNLLTKGWLDHLEKWLKSEEAKLIAKRYEQQKKALAKSRRVLAKPGRKVSLSDEQVIYARVNIKDKSYRELATEIKCSVKVLERAVKGLTFKHLNEKYKPQL